MVQSQGREGGGDPRKDIMHFFSSKRGPFEKLSFIARYQLF